MEVVAFILFIAVLGYGLQYVDNKTEKANVSDESSINDWKIQVPRGKIKLNGNKYEYYHDFENYLLIGTDATEITRTEQITREVWLISLCL